MQTVQITAGERPQPRGVIIAIPANNEAATIEACLAALAVQRDRNGAPLAQGAIEILVFANNCTDGTVALCHAMGNESPHPIHVVVERLPAEKANAGWARKRAMDLAAHRLVGDGRHDGVILTTDADSIVSPTWVDATLRAFAEGADAVAGYIDAQPAESLRLGRAFLRRGRLEDQYLSLMAEIYALCDPRPHDPWPNHRVSSGASLAVTWSAYLAIGGLPPKPLGEDAALTFTLDCAGFKVRHAMDVCVVTSCRFDGRAKGGAADTMRHRHAVLEAPCDEDMEPAFSLARRALLKGRLRRLHETGGSMEASAIRLGMTASSMHAAIAATPEAAFEELWSRLATESPVLRQRRMLRPADLPREIRRAALILRALTARRVSSYAADRADRSDRSGSRESVAA